MWRPKEDFAWREMPNDFAYADSTKRFTLSKEINN
tara:strand:- start:612 stop:716 length:105 start_codon:yes stop_codon:yes gene_type:complete